MRTISSNGAALRKSGPRYSGGVRRLLCTADSSGVCDNKMGSSEDIDVVPTALGGGSIVIHK